MTTVPPLDSSMFKRFAGSAVTSAGAVMLGLGAAGRSAGAAAIRDKATKGNANNVLDMLYSRPECACALSAGSAGLLARELRLHIRCHCRRDELADVAAVAGDFLDQP